MQIAFRDLKDPVVISDVIKHSQIILHLIFQKTRHCNHTIAFLGLGRRDDILPLQPLIGFCNGNCAFFKIKIRRRQRQELPFPNTAPVQHLKSVVRHGFVHHGVRELQILLLCPEQHLMTLAFPHAAGNSARILFEPVILDRMVKHCTELIVNGFQVDLRIRLPFMIFSFHQIVLPCNNLLRRDAAHLQLSEEWEQLCLKNVLFRRPCVFLQTRLQIFCVSFCEAAERHVHLRACFAKLLTFPRLGFALCLKAALLRLLPLTVPIGIAVNSTPCV